MPMLSQFPGDQRHMSVVLTSRMVTKPTCTLCVPSLQSEMRLCEGFCHSPAYQVHCFKQGVKRMAPACACYAQHYCCKASKNGGLETLRPLSTTHLGMFSFLHEKTATRGCERDHRSTNKGTNMAGRVQLQPTKQRHRGLASSLPSLAIFQPSHAQQRPTQACALPKP